MGKYSVKKVPPNVARDVRSIAGGDKELDHPYYVVEERKGTGKATCRQCHEVIGEGEPTVYFHYAPEDDNEWIRTRGTIHRDDCEGGKDEWTKCPKCRKQVPRAEWSDHWAKEKGKRVAVRGLDPTAKPGNSTSTGEDDGEGGYQPRVDPYSQDKMEKAQKAQLDQEARKLQRGMKGIDQFAGGKDDYYRKCQRCDGTGEIALWPFSCFDCKGTGVLGKDEDNTDPLGNPVIRVGHGPDPKELAKHIESDQGEFKELKRKVPKDLKDNVQRMIDEDDELTDKLRKSAWRVVSIEREWWKENYGPCDKCQGSGCGACRDSGLMQKYRPYVETATGLRAPRISDRTDHGVHYPPQTTECSSCEGSGHTDWQGQEESCYSCDGTGTEAHSDPRDQFEHLLSNYRGRKQIVGLQSNTGVHENEDYYHVRLHNTDILSFHKSKPEVYIDTGGWDTVTTKSRINTYLPRGIRIGSESTGPKTGWGGDRDLLVTTKAGGYKLRNGVTINTETGLEASGKEPDFKKCPECYRYRDEEGMPKHQKRHDTYRAKYKENPNRKCGDCNGTGTTDPWHTTCKDCKGLSMDSSGAACTSCRGSGIAFTPGAGPWTEWNYDHEKGKSVTTVIDPNKCGTCKGKGHLPKREPVDLSKGGSMGWRKVTKVGSAVYYIPEHKAMDIGKEEEEIYVVPEQIPNTVPEKAPVEEPVKVPQKVGASDDDERDIPAEKRTVGGEIIGYRHGLVAKRDGQWILHSPIKPMPWERGAVTASCGAGRDHEAPDKNCKCGLYAKWEEAGLAADYGNNEWITQVKAWGRVIPGSKGFRAQHMQVIGIRPPKCEQCDESATHMISANPDALSGRPTCQEHMPGSIAGGKIEVHAMPVDEVAKELSDYYGGVEVRKHGETWGEEDMAHFEKDFAHKDSYGWTSSRWAKIVGPWSKVTRTKVKGA